MYRAISRLKSVFVSFYKSEYRSSAGDIVINAKTAATRKERLDFVHPMENVGDSSGDGLFYDKGYELEFQMQVGSKLFPEYPIRSLSEAFSQLKNQLAFLVQISTAFQSPLCNIAMITSFLELTLKKHLERFLLV
jgi:hypothetical protein